MTARDSRLEAACQPEKSNPPTDVPTHEFLGSGTDPMPSARIRPNIRLTAACAVAASTPAGIPSTSRGEACSNSRHSRCNLRNTFIRGPSSNRFTVPGSHSIVLRLGLEGECAFTRWIAFSPYRAALGVNSDSFFSKSEVLKMASSNIRCRPAPVERLERALVIFRSRKARNTVA